MNPAYAVALGIGLVACITDLRSRRIPNWLTLGSALAGLIYHTVTGGPAGLLGALSGWGLGILFLLLPFALGGMGGGDVKLIGALGAWLGPALTLWVGIYTGIAGGILALVVALANGYLKEALGNVWLLLSHWTVTGVGPVHEVSFSGSKGPRLAYAIPIFAGTAVTLWLNR